MKEKLAKIEKKKLWMVGGFLLLIVVILFGGAFIYNKFFYKRSYAEIETIMVDAAKTHFAKNSNNLPQNINDVLSLSDNDLVATGEMKTIAEYLKDENTQCEGNVTVTNINGKYRYTPYLDCGNTYKTKRFMDYIHNTVPVVENGNGLYQLNEELVYRGDDVNNYLKFSSHLYRIVKFSNNYTVIILTENLESISWDDRYNATRKDSSGINDYSVSRIKEYLDDLYKKNTFISEEQKLLIVGHNLEIGKRDSQNTDKSGNVEKATIMENQFIGLLPLSDYLNASLDVNCTTSTNPSCVNYNYLSKFKNQWWTMTANNADTYRVYRVMGKGKATLAIANNNGYVRPVLYLAQDALYVSGDGSAENPYIVQ